MDGLPSPFVGSNTSRGGASVLGGVLLIGVVMIFAAILMYFVFTFNIPTTQAPNAAITQEQNGDIRITVTNLGNAEYLRVELIGVDHDLSEDELRLDGFEDSVTIDIDSGDLASDARVRVISQYGGTTELIRDYEPKPPSTVSNPAPPSSPSPPSAGDCPDPNNWQDEWDNSSEPYHVCTIEQLQSIDTYDRTASYVQHDTIDASATASWNSGRGFQPIGFFVGEYDGNGYVIKNLTIDRPNAEQVGVFGQVGSTGAGQGRVVNVTLDSSTITGQEDVGGIVGLMGTGTVKDITITDTDVTARITVVGGAIGETNANTNPVIRDIEVHGHVVAKYANSHPILQYAYAGGVIGRTRGSTEVDLINLRSYADVTSHYHKAGGIISWLGSESTLRDSYAKDGTVELLGGTWAGGAVAGQSPDAVIENTYSDNTVISQGDYVGGLVGVARGTIRDSYSRSDVQASGQQHVGGLVGRAEDMSGYPTGEIVRSYSTGQVTGNSNVGGLVGSVDSVPVTDSYWDTQASGVSTSAGGTGLNTGQMQGTAAKNNMFNDWTAWAVEGSNEYPRLNWQP